MSDDIEITPIMEEDLPAASGSQSSGVLDRVEILEPLSPALKQRLASRLERRLVPAGEPIFRQGDPGDALFVIERGSVSVFKTDPDLGLTFELARLPEGQAFGEMSLVTGELRSANVTAIEDSELMVLKRSDFFALVKTVPRVGLTVASVLARRLATMSSAQGIRFGALKGIELDPELLQLMPLPQVRRLRMVPVEHHSGIVTVATPNPHNRLGLDELRRLMRGLQIRLMVVTSEDFDAFVEVHLKGLVRSEMHKPEQAETGITEQLSRVVFHQPVSAGEDVRGGQVMSGRDVTQLVTRLFLEGVHQGASDIHLEPDRASTRVRFRVDGMMSTRSETIPRKMHASLISRIKVLAGLDITERRLPQDGRISMELGRQVYDLRLATVSTKYGEKMAIRVLDSSRLRQDLSGLIQSKPVLEAFRSLCSQTNGLVLVTGPTGSGKTTTMYAALMERNQPEVSISTVEDPIEFDLQGVSQVQINEAISFDFADAMRAFMRQGTDIIMVGETRDATTGRLACDAALTGHLVISSFHTNDALSTILRLREMGVEPFVLSSVLRGVLNQRLVRRVCEGCKTQVDISDLVERNLRKAGVFEGSTPLKSMVVGRGCDACRGEGFKGRVGLFELLVPGQAMRDAISGSASLAELREVANDGVYVSMSQYARFLLGEQQTSPTEVLQKLPLADEVDG